MIIDNGTYLLAGKTAHMLYMQDEEDVLSHVSMAALVFFEAKGIHRVSYGNSGEEYVALEILFKYFNLLGE